MPAGSTEDGRLRKVLLRPHDRKMVGGLFVTRVTRIVGVTTGKLQSNHIAFTVIVMTPRLLIDRHTTHHDTVNDPFQCVQPLIPWAVL